MATAAVGLALALPFMQGGGGGSPRTPSNNIVAALGDSMTRPTTMTTIMGTLWWAWFRRLMGEWCDFRFSQIFGTGGITTATILATYLGSAIAASAQTIFVMCGTNDCRSGSITLFQSIANITAIVDAIIAAGKIVVIADGIPWGGSQGDADQNAGIRDFIRSLHDPARGVYVVETWNAIATVPDGTTPVALYLDTDELHPVDLGAYQMAKAAVTAVPNLFAAFDSYFASGNLYTTGFTGGGVNTVPQVMSTNINAGVLAGHGTTFDMVDDDGIRWLVYTFNAAPVTQVNLITMDMASIALATLGLTANVDYVEYAIRYRANLTGFRGLGQQILYNGGSQITNTTDFAAPGSSNVRDMMASEYHEGVLKTVRALLPETTNKAQGRLFLGSMTGQAVSGQLWLGQPTIKKFAAAA